MKMTDEEAKEERVRKNANQRRWYAQLSEEKKDLLLQKKRERYAENKRQMLAGKKMELPVNTKLKERYDQWHHSRIHRSGKSKHVTEQSVTKYCSRQGQNSNKLLQIVRDRFEIIGCE